MKKPWIDKLISLEKNDKCDMNFADMKEGSMLIATPRIIDEYINQTKIVLCRCENHA